MSRSRWSWVCGVVFSLAPICVAAQGYTNVTTAQGIQAVLANTFNGAGMSFADFDNDGWDDLTFAAINAPLKFYRNNQGNYEELPTLVPITGHVKAVIWVDYDNDGDKDFFVTRFQNTSKLFRNEGNMQLVDVSEEAGIPQDFTAQTYGACFGDYDRDGWLDLYISNYNRFTAPTNWLLHNNGDGTFTDVSQSSGTHNETRYSFQSTFIDINHDLWPEIFVINDKNTQNTLYLNKGEEGFENVTEQAGFDFFMESMSNSISDFDRDGDLDIYITNTLDGNALYRNEGDTTFVDIGESAGVTFNSVCWGALWCDYDNNGWDDLYVLDANPGATDRNKFYRNNQNSTFDFIIPSGMFNDYTPGYSNTLGDINNDGYPDIALTNHMPTPATLWQNMGGTNAYVKILLEGTVSNRDGIGAWVHVYAGGSHQHKYTLCGDNYLGQNSQRLFFGLANETEMDSLVVEWPSGWVDKWFGLSANQTLQLVEGATIQNNLNAQGIVQLCPGDSLFLSTSLIGATVWNDGVEGNSRWITQSGTYSALTQLNGFEAATNQVSVLFEEIPQPMGSIVNPSCFGAYDGEINIVNASDYESIGWSTDSIGSHIFQLGAGTYAALFRTHLGCETSAEFLVSEPSELHASWQASEILCSGNFSEVAVTVQGGTAPYIFPQGWDGITLLPAGEHTFEIADANGCTVLANISIEEPEILSTSLELDNTTGVLQAVATGGIAPYSFQWNTGETTSSILPAEWGIFTCEIMDANQCLSVAEVNYQWLGTGDKHEAKVIVFPNPGNEFFQITSLHPIERLWLSDATGRLVLEHTKGIYPAVDTRHLADGTYFIQWQDHTGVIGSSHWHKVGY